MDKNQILEIDAGNSAFKWRLWSADGSAISNRSQLSEVVKALSVVLRDHPFVERARIVSVAGAPFDAQLKAVLQGKGLRSIEFVKVVKELGGVLCGYDDLSQLGVDRWMAVVAVAAKFSGPIIVVDMGSAFTVDFIGADKKHVGGYILPGWALMQNALVSGTQVAVSRNPVDYQVPEIAPGKSTSDAIGMARLFALSAVIDKSVIDFETREKSAVTVICTGGDAQRILPHIKASAIYQADLVLDGLAVALD